MADHAAETGVHRKFLVEPSSMLGDAVRYGLSLVTVVTCGVGLVVAMSRASPERDTAAETDAAIMIDLPPAEASSQPASDATDGVLQQAAPAEQPPEIVEPPKPIEEPRLAESEKPPEAPPPVPDPPAKLERERQPDNPPRKAATTASIQAQDAHTPQGSETLAKTDADGSEEGRSPPSAYAITLWQKSLMKRLEMARRQIGNQPHVAGTVKIAFEIDAKGGLAAERVAQSSGSAMLDKAALLLVRRAAPFSAPPEHAPNRDTSFVVPVHFR